MATAWDYTSWAGSNAVSVSNDGIGNLNFFYSDAKLYDWSQPIGATGWTKHLIGK